MLGSTGGEASLRGTLIDSKYTMTLVKKTVNSSTPTAMLYKMVLPFEFVDKILKCDHSNESYRAVLSCGAVAARGGSSF